jgi:hypothetical protein
MSRRRSDAARFEATDVSATEERLVVERPYRKSEYLNAISYRPCERLVMCIPIALYEACYLLLRARDEDDDLSLACTTSAGGVEAAALERVKESGVLLLRLFSVCADLRLDEAGARRFEDDDEVDVRKRHVARNYRGERTTTEEQAAEVDVESPKEEGDED